ncbi:MAG: dipeptidase [Gemmatimonadota bacterium]
MTPEQALRLHHEAFLFDGHNDVAWYLFEGDDVAGRRGRGHLDLPRMREGGFDGGIFAVWIDPNLPHPLERSLEGVERLHAFLQDTPGFRPVLAPADVTAAERRGEVAALIGVEGGYGITDDLSALNRLHRAGMRCLTLAWMAPTAWADASGTAPAHDGLSAFGLRVVERLQELGVVIDVSHASDRAVQQVLERADVPIAATHSGVRAVADHHRNLPDALVERLAAADGVIGINFFSAYLDSRFAREFEELRRRLAGDGPADHETLDRAAGELRPAPLERLLEHIEHAARVAGWEHVGLGSDFDGVASLPDGLRDARDLPRITTALAERGADEASLRALLGENFRRLLETVLA